MLYTLIILNITIPVIVYLLYLHNRDINNQLNRLIHRARKCKSREEAFIIFSELEKLFNYSFSTKSTNKITLIRLTLQYNVA